MTMDQADLAQAQLDALFDTIETDHLVYNPEKSEAFDDFEFRYGLTAYPTPPDSTAPSSAPTPDLSDYSFDQPYTGHLTPGPSTPHPYPVEQQLQCFDFNMAPSSQAHQRPRVLRSQTNTSYLAPMHQTPGYARRRSLSQSDVDHVAASNAPAPNPTFVRLQTPRSRSVTPDGTSRRRRAGQHSRSSSRRSNGPDRQSLSANMQGLVNGRVVKLLGDPMPSESPSYHRSTVQHPWSVNDGHSKGYIEDQVVFKHMARPEQMERSQKIIEIGAMAITGPVDPSLESNGATILKKLEEVEQYLKAECGGCEDVLRGCMSIREAVKGKMRLLGDDVRQ